MTSHIEKRPTKIDSGDHSSSHDVKSCVWCGGKNCLETERFCFYCDIRTLRRVSFEQGKINQFTDHDKDCEHGPIILQRCCRDECGRRSSSDGKPIF